MTTLVLTAATRERKTLLLRDFGDAEDVVVPFGPKGMPTTLAHHTWLSNTPDVLFFYDGSDATESEWPARAGGETLYITGSGEAPTVGNATIFTDGSKAVTKAVSGGQNYVGSTAEPFQFGAQDMIFMLVLKPVTAGATLLMSCQAGSGLAIPGWRVYRNSDTRYQFLLKDGTGNAWTGSADFVTTVDNTHVLVWAYDKQSTGFSCANGVVTQSAALTSMSGTTNPTAPLSAMASDGSIIAAAMWVGDNVFDSSNGVLRTAQVAATAQQIMRDIFRSYTDASYMIPVETS